MNRLIVIITLFISCLAIQAQDKNGCLSKEQFRERQKQYLVEKAGLTQEEAAKFFPLYFELQDKKFSYNKEMWGKIRKVKEAKNITDAEYSRITEDVIKTRITVDELELEYLRKYKKVLSPKKIYNIQRAEMKFSRELLKGAGQHKK
ncbi:hypothetical protein I6E11_02175 [Bacteroides caecigallinarum]|uniref:hypothetical protein n=1 Tax=Bacteroides caecigallinarum TaxID=1411144 RepID=UPI001F1B142D|nr:hypothetical protein [Bacteroides caecigallinarum]MCF2592627.1 hypothetical protein [Bacteroides caecigallinarum]